MCAPVHESGMLQRADTSVGPYRGSKVDLYFGGVANIDYAQRAGPAPPQQVADVFGILLELYVWIAYSGTGKPVPYVNDKLASTNASRGTASR